MLMLRLIWSLLQILMLFISMFAAFDKNWSMAAYFFLLGTTRLAVHVAVEKVRPNA